MMPPGKWETGTQNTEAIAGLRACLAYLGGLGAEVSSDPLSRAALTGGMQRIAVHEAMLSRRFITGLAAIPGTRLYGVSDPSRVGTRGSALKPALRRKRSSWRGKNSLPANKASAAGASRPINRPDVARLRRIS